ncbi:uncharacterized protein EDB91DRAFT_1241583 [Suillus paluster]|uniref:uncharacterized protein n=1 Tax=Suillus paluster TaxID=48578 RepID=UPI001B86A5AA|nr:uncharacterized protein EDB91DRAFT_1241583 [Suillus paluster]KAG1756532.1 hypothetical protein EDB91DRAFT_1241583 [Suillus paluster]
MSSSGEQQPLLPYPYDEVGASPERPKGTISVWRENVSRIVESQRFHTFVIALIVIDATCVLVDLGYTVLSDECAPSDENPAWLEALANVSLAITTLFLIEIPITLWAFGIRFYIPFSGITHAALHLFDAAIIVTTFILEFVLQGRERELAGLLIILRLWRLVKLVGGNFKLEPVFSSRLMGSPTGIAVGAAELQEETAKELEETRRQLEGTTAALAKARDENRKLRGRVAWLETGWIRGVRVLSRADILNVRLQFFLLI